MVKGFCFPAPNDTTSEPQVGNSLPGAPVNASMSGSVFSEQPGWNRGILQLLYPTPDLSGGGYFLYLLPKVAIEP